MLHGHPSGEIPKFGTGILAQPSLSVPVQNLISLKLGLMLLQKVVPLKVSQVSLLSEGWEWVINQCEHIFEAKFSELFSYPQSKIRRTVTESCTLIWLIHTPLELQASQKKCSIKIEQVKDVLKRRA